ncbi:MULTISPECIES: DUF397 domain-containing protein [Streptomyces]|uniref:DUF397 domain-containing protein n=1 Tax=Streptomyces evansiae TaxID=3075535 RepID=A0ABU2QVN2_9ACTN|nr:MULTISPECIES: DUF397 domain-containing protein [unclassified Streptomyces]MDT0407525.1 DUF397 domain-containing protein [Streptomyces sp. DSM 41979]MYQ61026.1 DUF397 domain-containing protein [Streptomyces sp. SID4926]SCE55532.1 protein of unknown function [Streptomyces sp. DfronAA-171]
MTSAPRWIKSSYSNNGGQCIEVATNLVPAQGIVPVRDSKNPGGPSLALHTSAFTGFVSGVKRGDFDV